MRCSRLAPVPRQPDPALIVLVGAAGSGKSTWAAAHYRASEIVASDALRAVVGTGSADLDASADAFAALDLIVAARLRRGLTTVIDTLGLDDARRAAYLDAGQRAGLPCVAVAFHHTGGGLPRPERPARPTCPDTGARSASAAIARTRRRPVRGRLGRGPDSRPTPVGPGRLVRRGTGRLIRGRIGREQARGGRYARLRTQATGRTVATTTGSGRRLRPQHFPISVGRRSRRLAALDGARRG
ncbi:MAG TPA: ATP-binding protein [Tetrasphaera sp.]|uniref:ATP-binding protein n=1 Tax=Nostocoides sp. TaxID=1917966 RepID=UPI002BE00BD1|nr:ATP-binding protein [Tetrasphaera sp.]HNQ05862.1 ATP-binding protein [Tetrasphaera sp.]